MRIGKNVTHYYLLTGIVGFVLLVLIFENIPFISVAAAEKPALEETTETDDDVWRTTLEQNDIQGYEDYLIRDAVGNHSIAAYLRLRNLYAIREWEKVKITNTAKALIDFILRYPGDKMSCEAHRLLESLGEKGDPRLKEIRDKTMGIVKRNNIKKKAILVFAVYATNEPSYFVYKNRYDNYVRVGWRSVGGHINVPKDLYLRKRENILRMEYLNGAVLPLLKFAESREGIVLFANQKEYLTNNGTDFSDAVFNLISDEFKISGNDFSLLYMTGKGSTMPDIIASSIKNDAGLLWQKTAPEPFIQSFMKRLDESSGFTVKKACFLTHAIEEQGYFQVRIIGKDAGELDKERINDAHNILNGVFHDWFRWEPTNSGTALYVNITVDAASPSFGRQYSTPEGKMTLYTDGYVRGSVYLSLSDDPDSSGTSESFDQYYGPPLFPGTKSGEEHLVIIPWETAKKYEYPSAVFYNTAFRIFCNSSLVPMLRRLLEDYFGDEIFTYNTSCQSK